MNHADQIGADSSDGAYSTLAIKNLSHLYIIKNYNITQGV